MPDTNEEVIFKNNFQKDYFPKTATTEENNIMVTISDQILRYQAFIGGGNNL